MPYLLCDLPQQNNRCGLWLAEPKEPQTHFGNWQKLSARQKNQDIADWQDSSRTLRLLKQIKKTNRKWRKFNLSCPSLVRQVLFIFILFLASPAASILGNDSAEVSAKSITSVFRDSVKFWSGVKTTVNDKHIKNFPGCACLTNWQCANVCVLSLALTSRNTVNFNDLV